MEISLSWPLSLASEKHLLTAFPHSTTSLEKGILQSGDISYIREVGGFKAIFNLANNKCCLFATRLQQWKQMFYLFVLASSSFTNNLLFIQHIFLLTIIHGLVIHSTL